MRLINADEAVEIAERSYDMWNMATAADIRGETNLAYKRLELCKAVKWVVEHCPTIEWPIEAKWIYEEDIDGLTYSHCSNCFTLVFGKARHNFCSKCGSKMTVE